MEDESRTKDQHPEDTSAPSSTPATSSATTKNSTDVNVYDQSELTKIRLEDLNWVEALHLETQEESSSMDVCAAMDDNMEFLRIEFDIGGDVSNRQRKALERNPVMFMV